VFERSARGGLGYEEGPRALLAGSVGESGGPAGARLSSNTTYRCQEKLTKAPKAQLSAVCIYKHMP
jgi:hypothetical protein